VTWSDDSLRVIGNDLAVDRYPRVWNNGRVTPDRHVGSLTNPGAETDNERQATTGPEPGSWKGAAAGQGKAGGSRSSGATASTSVSDLEGRYQSQLEHVERAYPGLRLWRRAEGLWLFVKARLIDGRPESAQFLVAVPYKLNIPKAWAFWQDGSWIGPRHTNFPDGSICCLYGPDASWSVGQPIVDLLDIYSVWAVRHLYLRVHGHWPGRQVAPLRHERLTETLDDEMCGCGSMVPYRLCHKGDDAKYNKLGVAVEFELATWGCRREPPKDVVDVLHGGAEPPSMSPFNFF
jgi:hypothetical protein